MRKSLAACVAVALLTIPATSSYAISTNLVVDQCPDPTRPIHQAPFCLTEAEFAAGWTPFTQTMAPAPQYVAPVDVVRTIAYHFWPDWAAERMIRIAECESGFDPGAVNPSSGAAGVWQVMPFHQTKWPGDYFDPWTNGAVAYQIWLDAYRRTGDGFRPWVCKG